VPAGVIVFSTTFLITDILSEHWGKKYARKAVWAGFYAILILFASVFIVTAWEAAPFASEIAEKFAEVIALTPRIAIAGVIAYMISQNHDVWAFHFWKDRTGGRYLWLRNNASTVTSQLLDSVIFIMIAFYGVFPVVPLIIGQWVVKIIIAAMDTPFIYGVLWLMKRVN
jgi:uncharacterized integral membrane protein (TIGR00697 family)